MKFSDKLIQHFVAQPYKRVAAQQRDPLGCQELVFRSLIEGAKHTVFGRDHGFNKIDTYNDFKQAVPLRNYESLLPYLERVHRGETDILWKGRPHYFGKTSGTTSRTKYIPVTKESLQNQLQGPLYAPAHIAQTQHNLEFLKGRVLLFSDGHFFEDLNGIPAAPISTIANSRVPFIYKWWQVPSNRINAIPDYEARIAAMIRACERKDIRTIAAMPVWFIVFLRKIERVSGKTFDQLFPKFQMLLVSGMDYMPFLPEIQTYIRRPFRIYESYPSTEGFIAYQDQENVRGMQLVLNNGIFYEFVELSTLHDDTPVRVSLSDVKPGIQYAMVLNTNAGLWGYINGDTVRFTSVFPHRILITGRIHHYISAFGEHVTTEETDYAIAQAAKVSDTTVAAYTVAPHIASDTLPGHEWFIEFGQQAPDLDQFAEVLEASLCTLNFSYQDLVRSKAIAKPRIRVIPERGFETYLQASGKTGLQQKIPAARNDYQLANDLIHILKL
jgi:hypothetical protein